jgi:hypothetical protein
MSQSYSSVEEYDREVDTQSSDTECEGCYLLNRGMGGENQMAHMNPGGCLYESLEDYNYDYDSQTSETVELININDLIIHQKISCVVCHNEKICKNTEVTKSYICNSCEFKEEREREIKYQSFTFTGYK